MSKSLDEIIESGPQPETEAVTESPATEQAPVAEAQAEPQAQEHDAGESEPELPEIDAPLPDDPTEHLNELHRRLSGFKTAYQKEKHKRQESTAEFERARQDYEQRLAAAQQPQPQQVQADGEILDPILDPEGYARSIRDQTMNEVRASNFRASCAAVEEAEPDKYRAAYSALDNLNPNHPIGAQVMQRLKTAANPGREMLRVYDELMANPTTAPEIALHLAMSDPAKRRELAAAASGAPVQPSPAFDPRTLPTNLVNARSVGRGGAQGAWTGQTPLKEILGGR